MSARHVLVGVALSAFLFTCPLYAGMILESELNDTFGTRQILPPGTTAVSGRLSVFDDTDVHAVFSGDLSVGSVDFWTLIDVAGRPFVSWMASNGGFPDTVLGTFGSFGNPGSLIALNDDGGPSGDYFSGIAGTVNDDGSANFGVTGWPDFSFDGSHSQSGAYLLNVQFDRLGFGDVDFFQFSNLPPGSPFTAGIVSGSIDSVLGLFDDAGTLLDFDDDGGNGSLSRLSGTVPNSGNLILAVSHFNDTSFLGEHTSSGIYELELVSAAAVVPEPSSFAIFGIGACVVGIRVARRRRGDQYREAIS